MDLREAVLPEKVGGARAAVAAAAVDDQLAVGGADLGQPPFQLLHRDVDRGGQMAARELLGRSNIEQARARRNQLARVGSLDSRPRPNTR